MSGRGRREEKRRERRGRQVEEKMMWERKISIYIEKCFSHKEITQK